MRAHSFLQGLVLWLMSMAISAPAGIPASVSGHLIVAGWGPERPMIEQLSLAFEKAHPGASVEIQWNRNLKADALVRSSEADIAVTGREASGLTATRVAWDGIALITNFSNPVKEITAEQAAALFSGRMTRWSELEGPDARVEIILRPADRNLNTALEHTLKIAGRLPSPASVLRSDQSVLKAVSGRLAALSYLSLGAAQEALTYGIPIRMLLIDRVEAAEPSIKDGRYRLRRPIFFLTRPNPSQTAAAFLAFARSAEGQKIVDEMFIPSGLNDGA